MKILDLLKEDVKKLLEQDPFQTTGDPTQGDCTVSAADLARMNPAQWNAITTALKSQQVGFDPSRMQNPQFMQKAQQAAQRHQALLSTPMIPGSSFAISAKDLATADPSQVQRMRPFTPPKQSSQDLTVAARPKKLSAHKTLSLREIITQLIKNQNV